MKYDLKEEKKNQSAFYLYEEDNSRMFVFGKCDIWIGKKGQNAFCNQSEEYHFDYQGNEKALTGKTGLQNDDVFDIKRIIVIQFK